MGYTQTGDRATKIVDSKQTKIDNNKQFSLYVEKILHCVNERFKFSENLKIGA